MMDLEKIDNFLALIKSFDKSLKFEIIEVGAHPYEGKEELFYRLLDFFPNSKINAFEIDKAECQKLNKSSKNGVEFFPYALGYKEELRKFYETNHPMCSSLYEPDIELLKLYHNLEVSYLKNILEIKTISIDKFMEIEKIKSVDFIKIDIQGAELDVFKGANKCLENILSIVSEVEFIKIYKNQPLFGDVCSFLSEKDIMFHKFLGFGGRSLKPIIVNNDKNHATQLMWSDAIFIKNIFKIPKFSNSQLLKLAVFSYLYGSLDLTVFCLLNYDKKNKTNIVEQLNIKNKTKK
jgi:FkbM family methyltransferase|tara:strand:- start:149 stop:1024 length:876 start_codon:yes stop_codon:yes gene_type:complete